MERIEPNRAREVESREEQLSAPNSSTNPDLGKRRGIEGRRSWLPLRDLRPGSEESFLIGGFLALRLLLFFRKSACVYLHANYTHTNKYKYRGDIRGQKGERKEFLCTGRNGEEESDEAWCRGPRAWIQQGSNASFSQLHPPTTPLGRRVVSFAITEPLGPRGSGPRCRRRDRGGVGSAACNGGEAWSARSQ